MTVTNNLDKEIVEKIIKVKAFKEKFYKFIYNTKFNSSN